MMIRELERVGKGKYSQRIDELVLKGIEFEKKESMAAEYARQAESMTEADWVEHHEENKHLASGFYKPQDDDNEEDWY